jgi:hypothetical protein
VNTPAESENSRDDFDGKSDSFRSSRTEFAAFDILGPEHPRRSLKRNGHRCARIFRFNIDLVHDETTTFESPQHVPLCSFGGRAVEACNNKVAEANIRPFSIGQALSHV